MNTYCVKCKRKTGFRSKPNLVRTKNNRLMLRSICNVCGSKKTRFVSAQQGKGLLSMLGIKTPLAKIPIIGDIIG